mgnify:CR=1 FL=1
MTVYVIVPANKYRNKDCMAGIYYSENAALQNGHPYRSFPDLEEAYMYLHSKNMPSHSKWTLCNRTHLYTLNTPITETTKKLAEMLKQAEAENKELRENANKKYLPKACPICVLM